jgi:hypothetical protein
MTTIGVLYPAHIAVGLAKIRLTADQTSKAATTTIEEDKKTLSNAQLAESEQAAQLVDVTV